MNEFQNTESLRIIRALALLISEQDHLTRQTLMGIPCSAASNFIHVCQRLIPSINWQSLLQERINCFASELDNSVSIFETQYPNQLRNIQDPPWILFFNGQDVRLLESRNCISIVGSRRADYAGLELAEQCAYALAKQDLVIVSGLALGIDTAAHKGALKTGKNLSTVAVLGSGINVLYPAANKQLYSDIVKSQGIVFSQFEPDSPPYPSNFLNRNRVVAGLSSATIVIQATLKSGSLVTARHSIEQGKDVYVIPGDIDNRRYEGSNRLIQQGAQLITGIDDLLLHLGLQVGKKKVIKSLVSDDQSLSSQIIKILQDQGQVKVDAMVRQLGNISFEKELLELEINGQLERLPGNVLKLTRS